MPKIFFKDLNTTKYFRDQSSPINTTAKFIDFTFPPDMQSLIGFDSSNNPRKIDDIPNDFKALIEKVKWARARDLDPDAVLFDGAISSENLQQGNIGNCYFMAAVADLAFQPHYIWRLFKQKKYNPQGCYEINLFLNGEWQTVIVDDHFPVLRNGSLAFARPSKSEIWPMLLEKAWAKVSGGYYNTNGGISAQIFHVLTGQYAVIEKLDTPSGIFKSIESRMKEGGLVVGLTKNDDQMQEIGLIKTHFYSIVGAFSIKNSSGQLKQIIQLRNPWGDKE